MGTINYFTSDYVTLGYNTNSIDYEDEYYNEEINFEYDEITEILKGEYFYYFHIVIKPGYYEGFTIDIENNFSYCFNDYHEKREALKEVTQIKNFLLYIVDNFNINVVYPGWCTSYGDYKKTIEEINAAIKEMKSEIKTTPTYYTLKEA